MSRAFVDEDAGLDEADGMFDIPLPIPPGAKNYMTAEGAEGLAAELRALRESERPRAAAALAAAQSSGMPPAGGGGASSPVATAPEGASDPAAALRRLSELDRRISYLVRMRAALEVVALPQSAERVVFGLRVRVAEEGLGEREYRVVGADESDPARGLLSWASPVAKALIGKRVGETALARLPLGEKRMKVLWIGFPGE